MPKKPYPNDVAPVGHLCGDIADVMRIVRRHTPIGHPDRKRALDLCREVEHGVHQLRFNQNHFRNIAGE
jgi:hypothetical protein